jgi:transmembrane sensor
MKEFETDPVYIIALDGLCFCKTNPPALMTGAYFSAWIASDPAHQAAHKRAQMVWQRFRAAIFE